VIVGCDSPTCWPGECQSCFASCWNSTKHAPSIVAHLKSIGKSVEDPQSFYELWKNFTIRAQSLVEDAFTNRSPQNTNCDSETQCGCAVPLEKMLQWAGSPTAGSTVTYNLMGQSDIEVFLPKDKFALEVWDNLEGSLAPQLMKQGYDVVLAHTDYVYLDCGS